MDPISEKPWQDMKPAINEETMRLTANTYGVFYRDLSAWMTAYVLRFSQGPATFIPWYKQQTALWQSGELRFQPYYPHEMYPDLLSGASWLYDHPAWKRP